MQQVIRNFLHQTRDATLQAKGDRSTVALITQSTAHFRHMLELSQEEARQLQHNYIGTEHLLLGILREEESMAARALKRPEVTVSRVRAEIAMLVGRGDTLPAGPLALTLRAKKVLELAASEAQSLNQQRIDSGHLLLGIIEEGGGLAAGVLQRLRVDLAQVRSDLIDMLNATQES